MERRGVKPVQYKEFSVDHRIGRTSGMVLEAPQPSLTWSFMLGVLMARRWAADHAD